MKKVFKALLYFFGFLLLAILLVFAYTYFSYSISNAKAKGQLVEKKVITVDGITFRDLNGNGKLDIYEDKRQAVEARVEDLLSQMTLAEKAGLMWHPPMGMSQTGEVLDRPSPADFFLGSSYDLLITKKYRHFNLFRIPKSNYLAKWYNAIQKIAEQDRLGIPVTISSDPRHGANNFLNSDMLNSDFSKWPEPIGFAAINDSLLTVEFGRMASEELRAVGIRTGLHPMADLATEPRWARINGTFGEDAYISARHTAAYIYGFQGDSLSSNSVAMMTKHWPGGGPQEDGEDAHFRYGKNQAYPGNNFDYHLIPFKAAFEAGTAMIMPYYGIPVGQTSEEVAMNFNKEIITNLLRNEYNYDGIVCTDWGVLEGWEVFGREIVSAKDYGVENFDTKGKVKKAIDAGVDQFGGNDNVDDLIKLVEAGEISETRINASARRLLKAKFQMGLFDNPYIEEAAVNSIVGRKDFVKKGKIAQRRCITLLKNEQKADSTYALPLQKNLKIYIENINPEIASQYATVVENLEEADMAILRLAAPFEPRSGDMIESFFHQGDLDFKEPEKGRILSILQSKPSIVCMYLDRAAVIPEIAANAEGLLADFGVADDAVLDVIFGNHNPAGKLPFELPSSMEAVLNQQEDVPYDSKDPLFPFGFGLSYEYTDALIETTELE